MLTLARENRSPNAFPSAVNKGFKEVPDDGEKYLPNPLQNPAAALQEVMRRFDDILRASGNSDEPSSSTVESKQRAFEHARGSRTEMDMLALGPVAAD